MSRVDKNELKIMIKEDLAERGVLDSIQKELNEKVTSILTNEKTSSNQRKELSSQNGVINELIREYLEFNYYQQTYDTFIQEAHCPQNDPIDRNYLSKHLKILEDKNTKQLPLLYGIAFGQKKLLNREMDQQYDEEQRYVSKVKINTAQNQRQIYQEIFNMDQPKAMIFKS